MKRLMLVLGFAFFSSAALAESEAKDVMTTDVTPADVQAVEAKDVGDANKAEKATAKLNDRNCLRHTGSRIPRKDKDDCINAPGRSYSKDDLDRTGAITAAEALERLDPAVTIHR